MKADPKRKPYQGDHDCANRARRYQEEALDDALKNIFPASDPVSIGQPTPPAAPRQGKASPAWSWQDGAPRPCPAGR